MDNVLEFVKGKWQQLTAVSKKEELKQQLWEEIQYRYSEQHRHYHNLSHLAHLFSLCDQHIDQIKNPAVLGFAILYHDIIYDTYRSDNEEQSAELAASHLTQLKFNNTLINKVKEFIIASKDHQLVEAEDMKDDLALFLDLDMAILAEEADLYKMYSEKIRLEYSKYSDPIYKEGRKLALKKVLESQNIFWSPQFKEQKEVIARENIRKEVNLL